MRIVRIPKRRRGEYRTIYVPNGEEKYQYQLLLPALQEIANRVCDPDIVHGFMPARSPVSNAWVHRRAGSVLTMDLKDFFDTVTEVHLRGILPDELMAKVLVNGGARQGLPTSPIVANIAAAKMDRAIKDYLTHWEDKGGGVSVVFTRYADDLAFSYQGYDLDVYTTLKSAIAQIVRAHGFTLNEAKTHLQDSRYGRIVVTGVGIKTSAFLFADGTESGNCLIVPRAIRRKIRAALDQGHDASAAGLREWAKLKLPHPTAAHTMRVFKGVFQARRGRLALTNYGALGMWDARIAALCVVEKALAIVTEDVTQDRRAQKEIVRAQMKHLKSLPFPLAITPTEVKHIDAIIRETDAKAREAISAPTESIDPLDSDGGIC